MEMSAERVVCFLVPRACFFPFQNAQFFTSIPILVSWQPCLQQCTARPIFAGAMEGQFTLDSSENKKLQLALQQYVTQNTPQIKPVEAETDDPITNREILPQTHTLECRTCGVEFETHADMVTHFKSSSHLEAKELGIQAKSTSGSTGDSNVVSRDAACAPQRPTIDVHGVRSKNSPKTSLRIPLPQTESNATADVFIRTWKILVDGSLSASQSSAAKSMTENFLELLHDRGSWAVLSLQNGFFAGAIFDRRGKPVLHKTFQRFVRGVSKNHAVVQNRRDDIGPTVVQVHNKTQAGRFTGQA